VSLHCRVEPVSWKPRAFVFHNFMTEEEADHIVGLAKPFVSAGPAAARPPFVPFHN
jgi:hypothetical protein